MNMKRPPHEEAHLMWQTLQPRENRWKALGQRPVIVWLTGLSGAGKSSIANVVDQALTQSGRATMVIDGDNLRHGLSSNLGFSELDRSENIRRAAETAKILAEAGIISIVSLISPLRKDRAAARAIVGDIPFLEVFVSTPLEVCEARDPKGLYRLARAGQIKNFTGISAPYDVPVGADITLETEAQDVSLSALPLIIKLLHLSTDDVIGNTDCVPFLSLPADQAPNDKKCFPIGLFASKATKANQHPAQIAG